MKQLILKNVLSFYLNLVITATFCCIQTSAQTPFIGSCPSIDPVSNFNLKRYLGKWYEIRSYPAFFSIGSACTQAEYSLFSNGSVQVNNSAVGIFGNRINIVGNAVLNDPTKGWLTVNFPSTGGPATAQPNYMVVATDYDNYAVVHSCSSFLFLNFQFGFVLARQRKLTPELEVTVSNILQNKNIANFPLFNTRQTDCPVF